MASGGEQTPPPGQLSICVRWRPPRSPAVVRSAAGEVLSTAVRSRTVARLRRRRWRIRSRASKRQNAAVEQCNAQWAPQPVKMDQDGVAPPRRRCVHRGQTDGPGNEFRPMVAIRGSAPGSKMAVSTLTPRSASLSVKWGRSPVAFSWPRERPTASVPMRKSKRKMSWRRIDLAFHMTDLGHLGDSTGAVLQTGQVDYEVQGGGELLPDGPHGKVEAGHQRHGLDARRHRGGCWREQW